MFTVFDDMSSITKHDTNGSGLFWCSEGSLELVETEKRESENSIGNFTLTESAIV